MRKGDTLVARKLDRMFLLARRTASTPSSRRSSRGVSLFLLDLNGGADDVSRQRHRAAVPDHRFFAAFERDRIGERIRATKQAQKARGGTWVGGRRSGSSMTTLKQLQPVPEQQQVLRRIRKLASEGLTPPQDQHHTRHARR